MELPLEYNNNEISKKFAKEMRVVGIKTIITILKLAKIPTDEMNDLQSKMIKEIIEDEE
jgi:hypothetical protein